jgi:hypothetical protein
MVTVLESPADTISCIENRRLSRRWDTTETAISGLVWRREIWGREAERGVKEEGGSGSRGRGDRRRGKGEWKSDGVRVRAASER